MRNLEFVNTQMGTLNESRFSNGNIYPVTACPFGMANFCIQTNGGNWFYSPLSHAFEGIRLTHQPSPWVGDYGHILMLPYSGELCEGATARWSSFRPENTVIRPERIEAYLQRYRVRVTLVPTERGAQILIENESGLDTGFAFIPFAASCFRAAGNTLTGYTDSQSIWNFKRIREYFYVEFSEPVLCVKEIEQGGVALRFAGKKITVSLATSFISEEQAKRNFFLELRGKTLSVTERAARELWESYLGRIEVSNEDPERKRTFYSCMYRALLYPRKFYEYGENGEPVHFNADTNKAEAGLFYTDNGFWDTYRTEFPFLTILAPELVREMIEGFVNYSEETGWLPKWLSPGEIGLMPGTLVEAVIADACVKGIVSGGLRDRAYRAMLKNAYEADGDARFGRRAVKDYISFGYVPGDVKECVNHTCDCAYGDYCIARVAQLVGDGEEAEKLFARSKNYRNLFDPETRFLRGKDREGNFREAFDPYDWGGDNCEGSSWQNSFAVYHDIAGLAALHGGEAAFEKRLDELFAAPPVYNAGGYGEEIHEMSEMACADFGQCAISNQPSFHIPWLYAEIGNRKKTEYWVEKLATEAFSCTVDGFPGDEDNGTTACWYLFACLGFYPICPSRAEYIAGKPLFKKIKIGNRVIKRYKEKYVLHTEIAGKEESK